MTVFDCDAARRCQERQLAAEPLADGLAAALEAHLAICEDCRRREQIWTGLGRAVREAPLPGLLPMTERRMLAGRPPATRPEADGAGSATRRLAAAAAVIGASVAAVITIAMVLGPTSGADHPASDPSDIVGVAVADGEVADARPHRDPDEDAPAMEGAVPQQVDPLLAPEATEPASVSASVERAELGEPPRADTLAAADPAAAIRAIEIGDLDHATELALTQLQKAPDSPQTIDTLTRLAQAHRSAQRHDDASAIYLRLIEHYPDSTAAGNSLVALGQMELRSMDRPTDALGHFDEYIERFPTGVLAPEARVGRVRALETLGDDAALITAAGDYLRSHPEGSAAAEVLRRRGDAQCRSGLVDEGTESYETILQSWPGSPYTEAAQRGLEQCQDRR